MTQDKSPSQKTSDTASSSKQSSHAGSQLNSKTGKLIHSFLCQYDDPKRSLGSLTGEDATDDGRYRVVGELGKGGMGVVLEADDDALQRTVAVKMTQTGRAASSAGIFRFVEEAQITAQLEHPNIIPVYELNCTSEGRIYYTMKRISGNSLRDVLKGLRDGNPETVRHYSLTDLLNSFVKVCSALSYAHSRGVIHRDVKPANIMVGEFGEVLLLDWGLARAMSQPDSLGEDDDSDMQRVESTIREEMPELTQRGAMAGTVGYAAPEQLCDAARATAQSDVYSLAATLYSIISLRSAFGRGTIQERILNTLKGDFVPLHEVVTESCPPHLPAGVVPDALVGIVSKGMSLKQSERYQSADEMAADVNAYLSGIATSMEKRRPLSRLWLLMKRNVVETAIVSVALLAFMAVTGVVLVTLRSNNHQALTLLADAQDAADEVVTERQKKESYLKQVLSSAPSFAEQAMVDLERMDKRRLPLKNPEIEPDKRFRIGTARAELNMDAAINLDPKNPRFWMQKGTILQNPKLLALDVVGESAGGKRALSVTFRFKDAIAAFRNALLYQGPLGEQDIRKLREEIEFCRTMTESVDAGTSDAIVMARLINWFRRRGRATEANVYGPALRVYTIKRLNGMTDELRAAGLTYLSPDAYPGMPPGLLVQSHVKTANLAPLRGMFIDRISLENLPADKDDMGLDDIGFRELAIADTAGRFDFSNLSSSSVEKLFLGNSKLEDLAPLALMHSLEDLTIRKAPIRDLYSLCLLKLTRLGLCGSMVATLDSLDVSQLRWLEICHSRVTSLEPLRGAPLELLNLVETPVESLSPLEESPIVTLLADNSLVRELGRLNVSKLRTLGLRNCPITSITALRGAPLIFLSLGGTGVTDFEPLRDMPLRELDVADTKVKDLAFLESLKLKTLNISDTQVEDLTPLRNMPLRFLYVEGCPIEDFSPLATTPLLALKIDRKQIAAAYPVIARMPSLYKIEIKGSKTYYRRTHFLRRFAPKRKKGETSE